MRRDERQDTSTPSGRGQAFAEFIEKRGPLTTRKMLTSGSTYAGRVKLYVSGTTDSVLNEAGTNDVTASIIVRITANGFPG